MHGIILPRYPLRFPKRGKLFSDEPAKKIRLFIDRRGKKKNPAVKPGPFF
jgi:hypothetical protein